MPIPTNARRFVLVGLASSVGLFALSRLPWSQLHLVLPATRLQGRLAERMFGMPSVPVQVTEACSGTDALALCLGIVLSYPVAWRRRLIGACLTTALLLILNTARIGSLGRLAASPAAFQFFHLYLWPAALTLLLTAFVFAWMRAADRPTTWSASATAFAAREAEHTPLIAGRFFALALVLLIIFVATSPLYFGSAAIAVFTGLVARLAAALLDVVGVNAYAASNVLWTSDAGFLVTPECIVTPLAPLYMATVWTYMTGWRRVVALATALPLFVGLGVVRLLLVAVPGTVIASPLFAVHAFYQVLLAGVIVFFAARWIHRGRVVGHALLGVAVGAAFVYLLGGVYTQAVTSQLRLPIDDVQGAAKLLPAFQIGLYLALWAAAFVPGKWLPVLAGLVLLPITQAAGLVALDTFTRYTGVTAHVRDIRGWAIAAPVLIFVAAVSAVRGSR